MNDKNPSQPGSGRQKVLAILLFPYALWVLLMVVAPFINSLWLIAMIPAIPVMAGVMCWADGGYGFAIVAWLIGLALIYSYGLLSRNALKKESVKAAVVANLWLGTGLFALAFVCYMALAIGLAGND